MDVQTTDLAEHLQPWEQRLAQVCPERLSWPWLQIAGTTPDALDVQRSCGEPTGNALDAATPGAVTVTTATGPTHDARESGHEM